ncbi:MAG: polysaccharide biosynthesis protein [Frankiales bacterium]|nr:polysaccharide biosynthesis protein [Frankiales bacterium]
MLKTLIYSALARILGFVPQGIATLIASNLILREYGVNEFSSYVLVLSVLLLIPLNNLGAAASVTQVVAAHGVDSDLSRRTAVTAARVLLTSGGGLTIVSVVLGVAGLWPRLLGSSSVGNLWVTAAIVLYGISFVPALGLSVLLGAGRNHLAIAVQALTAVLSAVFVGIMVLAHLDKSMLVAVPALAILLTNLLALVVSQRVTGFSWTTVLRQAPFRRVHPGARIRSLALPMLITSLALPIAFLADRVVLSHVSTDIQVARYALVLQLFSPVTGLIMSTAQPLWPMFTRARATGGAGPQMAVILSGFLGATVVISAVLVLLADPIGSVVSDHRISLGVGLPALAAGVTLLQAALFPLTMSMADPAGARIVAISTVLSVPANLALSIYWGHAWGAPGPMLSMLVVSVVLQLVPWAVFSVRRHGSGVQIGLGLEAVGDGPLAVVRVPTPGPGRHRR